MLKGWDILLNFNAGTLAKNISSSSAGDLPFVSGRQKNVTSVTINIQPAKIRYVFAPRFALRQCQRRPMFPTAVILTHLAEKYMVDRKLQPC